MILSHRRRMKLHRNQFALPKERKYPIYDRPHARNALARVSQFGTEKEQRVVRLKVHNKYPDIEINKRQ